MKTALKSVDYSRSYRQK